MERLEALMKEKAARDQDFIAALRPLLARYVQSKLKLVLDESVSSQSSSSSYLSARSKSPMSRSFFDESACRKSLSSHDLTPFSSAKSTVFLQVPSMPVLISPFSEEETQQLELCFKGLIARLEGTSGVRSGKTPQIFIENIRQYWLSAYAVTDKVMSVLMEPLLISQWVSCNRFKHAVERIYLLDDLQTDSLARAKWRSQVLTFKLLCTVYAVFFKLLSLEDTMHRSELPWVFSLALKTSPSVDPELAAKRIIAKIDAIRGFSCDVTTLPEFFEAIISRL